MSRGLRVVLLVIALVAAGLAAMAVTLLAIGATGPPGAGPAAVPPRFVEEGAAAGISHAYTGDFEFYVGGGVAAFDCNEDGKPELYFAGGSEPAALYRNESTVGGALRFSRVSSAITDLDAVTGAYPLDIDGDAHTDLVVLRFGENVVLRGLGDCVFERANERWAVDGGDEWTVGFSATWEGDSSLPTLAFGNYLEPEQRLQAGGGCEDSVLLRPESDARYGTPIPLTPGYCTLSILFSDWSRAGRRDLRMTNDRHYYRDGEEQLWRVAPGEPPRLYTRDEGWAKMQIWGMGIASHDLTGDGRPEVYLTSQADNKLQTLAGDPSRPEYRDIALRRGVTAHRPFTGGDTRPSTAWHAEFADVNNDARVDLFVSKGNVEAQDDFALRDPSNLLLGEAEGTFTESAETAGVLDYGRARGAALVDLNLDGMLDVVRVDRRENVKLWRNVGSGDANAPAASGDWVALRLEQAGTNRDGVGAWVQVRVGGRIQEREVTVGGGHAGGQSAWIHFGLGDADRADVRVQWPDGQTGPWQTVDVNAFAIIERDGAAPRAWTP